jgi:hypothetical protein
MQEIEKNFNKKVWAHENRERLSLKGRGLINFQSRLTRTNPVSAEIEAKIRLMYSDDRSLKE